MSISTPQLKIISGAQTGVNRGALDAAMEHNIPVGGWCPEGRLAEDGIIPNHYPVQELSSAGYQERTYQNVVDSDGTVIIYFGYPTGGTELTLSFCIKEQQPYVLIDALELTTSRATQKIQGYIDTYNITILNVAGPRASSEPNAYHYAKEIISALF